MLDKLFIAILNWSATLKINILFCPLRMFSELHYLTPCCKPKWKSKQQKSVGRCCISASIPTFCSKILVCRIPFPWVIQFITNDSAPAIILRQRGMIRVSFDLTLWITDLESHTPKATGAWAVLQEEVYWFSILNKTLRRKDYCKRSADYPAGSWHASCFWNKVHSANTWGDRSWGWDCASALGLFLCIEIVSHHGSNPSKWKEVCEQHVYMDLHLSTAVDFIHFMPKKKQEVLFIFGG